MILPILTFCFTIGFSHVALCMSCRLSHDKTDVHNEYCFGEGLRLVVAWQPQAELPSCVHQLGAQFVTGTGVVGRCAFVINEAEGRAIEDDVSSGKVVVAVAVVVKVGEKVVDFDTASQAGEEYIELEKRKQTHRCSTVNDPNPL